MSVLTRLSLASVVVFVSICIFWGMAVFAPTQSIVQESLYANIARLYVETQKIHQSRTVGKQIEGIVNRRVDCYLFSPFERVNRCVIGYTTELVSLGRQEIQSAPDLSGFLESVHVCPIMYAVCMGEIGDPVECISIEARCLDGMYDTYWRGQPFTH